MPRSYRMSRSGRQGGRGQLPHADPRRTRLGFDPAGAHRRLRTADEIAGAAEVGVDRVDLLDHPDGVLEYGLALRRDITRTIRALRPDVVCAGPWEIEDVAGLNQSDHPAPAWRRSTPSRCRQPMGGPPNWPPRVSSLGRCAGSWWVVTSGPPMARTSAGSHLSGRRLPGSARRPPGRHPWPPGAAGDDPDDHRDAGPGHGRAERSAVPGAGSGGAAADPTRPTRRRVADPPVARQANRRRRLPCDGEKSAPHQEDRPRDSSADHRSSRATRLRPRRPGHRRGPSGDRVRLDGVGRDGR